MITLLSNPEQIITVNTNGKNFKRGKEQSDINVLTDHSLIIEDDLIKDIVPNSSINRSYDKEINLKNKIILPGLVECHTHSVFTGSRAAEFNQRISGKSYEEIAASGGGINTTVKAVRNSSFEEIVEEVKPRINHFISQGITTLEIKSGYGLNFENEIKLLKVINYLNKIFPIDIIPTFLGAHTFPDEFKDNHISYIKIITNEMLPFILQNKLAHFCDGFCEKTAFSSEEIATVLNSAFKLGFKIRLHTDQFNSIGGLDEALRYNAVSVDHLEVIEENNIKKLSNRDITVVLLPGVSFFLNYQYAPARKLIDENVIVALSTDFNPGSSNIPNLHLVMSLGSLKMNMKIEETISAVTINAAKVLQMEDKVGSIEIGKKADLSLFSVKDYSEIVYTIGKNRNEMTIKNGKIIFKVS